MSVAGLDHPGLIVGNLERSIAFYCDLLGLRLLGTVEDASPQARRITGYANARLRIADLACANGDLIELIEYVEPRRPARRLEPYDIGVSQVGLRVADIAAVHRRLVAALVVVRSDPVTIAAPGIIWDGVRAFYALDPDGRTVELIEWPAGPPPRP